MHPCALRALSGSSACCECAPAPPPPPSHTMNSALVRACAGPTTAHVLPAIVAEVGRKSFEEAVTMAPTWKPPWDLGERASQVCTPTP